MAEQPIQTFADPAQVALIQKKLYLENRIRANINWFYWIAALSLVNTLTHLVGANFTFVIGLGATQIVDAFASIIAEDLGESGMIVTVIGIVLNLIIAAIFALFGFLGRKHHRAWIIVGMILYALDGVVLLFFEDFLGAGFHAFALFGIWNGLKAIGDLKKLDQSPFTPTIQPL